MRAAVVHGLVLRAVLDKPASNVTALLPNGTADSATSVWIYGLDADGLERLRASVGKEGSDALALYRPTKVGGPFGVAGADAEGAVVVHIGKTGGTNVKASMQPLNMSGVGVTGHNPELFGASPAAEYIFYVRDPVRRYASAWISRFREGRPHYSCPWNDKERAVFEQWKSPDAMAKALSNKNKRASALQGFQDIGHVRNSLSVMLGGPAHLRAHLGQVLFVGRTEHLDTDFLAMQEALGREGYLRGEAQPLLNSDDSRHATPDEYTHLEQLSAKAVANLREYYRDDYEILRILVEARKLPESYLAEVGA